MSRPSNRPKRTPISRQRDILTAPKEPGKIRRFINDIGSRVQDFLNAGYTIVQDKVQVGDKGVVNNNQAVGSGARRHVGGGTQAILVEIDEELYREDQKAKAKEVAEVEAELFRELNDGRDGKYGSVRIKR